MSCHHIVQKMYSCQLKKIAIHPLQLSPKYEMTKTETRDDVVKLYTYLSASAAVMYGISSLNTFCSIVVNLYSVLQNIISDI